MKYVGKVTRIISLFLLGPLMMVSCETQQDVERDRRIFALHAKIIRLEKALNLSKEASLKSGKNLSRGLAESQIASEHTGRQIQLLEGKLQTLEQFLGLGDLRPDEFASEAPNQKIQVLRSDVTHIHSRIDAMEKRLETLNKTQNELFQTVENVLKQAAERKVASSSSPSKKKRAPISSLAAVEKAFAEKRFTHIVQDYSALKSVVKKEEQYDLSYFNAASLFKLGRISDAALAFDDLLKIKKTTDKLPHIYLRLGDCFRLLGKKDVALIYYEELVEKFPSDSRVKLAKDYLKKLRKS